MNIPLKKSICMSFLMLHLSCGSDSSDSDDPVPITPLEEGVYLTPGSQFDMPNHTCYRGFLATKTDFARLLLCDREEAATVQAHVINQGQLIHNLDGTFQLVSKRFCPDESGEMPYDVNEVGIGQRVVIGSIDHLTLEGARFETTRSKGEVFQGKPFAIGCGKGEVFELNPKWQEQMEALSLLPG